jgi:hypothetical protein
MAADHGLETHELMILMVYSKYIKKVKVSHNRPRWP